MQDAAMSEAAGSDEASPKGGDLVRRHRLSTRIWHWVNVVTLLFMLGSGLMIFNAHPRLYWGQYGANFDRPWLAIGATTSGEGVLHLGRLTIPTTGVLGVWKDPSGAIQFHAFPWWATIPSHYDLAGARVWHLAFAWVLAFGLLFYLIASLANGHLRRDVHISAREWRPAHILRDIREHARLRFPTGAAALRYNVLQKLAYAGVLFVLLPGVILTGLAMSPGMDAAWPWLTVLLGGRQSARSIHFLCASGLVGFFVVHIVMVLLAGPINEVRAMITGWYRLPKVRGE
jgi:thiosulfate reductase cytochrome b subunit